MSQESESPLLIMGTGAMACLFAARLSAAEVPVKMFGSWKEGLNALRYYGGVRFVRDSGEEDFCPVQVIDNLSDCKDTLQTIVLVKSWQTAQTTDQLADCLDVDGMALTLQNGLGNWETLAKKLGKRRVALGVTTVGATLLEPGRVVQAGEPLVSVSDHPRLERVIGFLRKAGFTVEKHHDPTSLLWGKLIINAAINPITALIRIPNGGLLEYEAIQDLIQAAVNEAASVAAINRIRLPYSNPTEAVLAVARATAKNRSSMLQDILRGAPTEIDAICGEIVKLGETSGVPTPVLRTLWLLVKSLQRGIL